MTNSEMCIDALKLCKKTRMFIPSNDILETAISTLEENDKLKAEIEQLKSEFETYYKLYLASIDARQILTECVEQLKSELEQSVKLPCKCENCKYADFMSASAERFYCMEHGRYMNVGGYCSFGKSEE